MITKIYTTIFCIYITPHYTFTKKYWGMINTICIFFCSLCRYIFLYGGAKEDRTPDLLRAKQALSQLSYGPYGGSEKI